MVTDGETFLKFWDDFTQPPAGWVREGSQRLERERLLKRWISVLLYLREVVELQVEHRIPDVLGDEKHRYDGKLTMVVGAGASAATVLQSLKALGTTKVSSNVKVSDSLLEKGCMGHKERRRTLCCTRRGSFAPEGEALQAWKFVGSLRRGNPI